MTSPWGRDPHPLISVDQAWQIIQAQVKPLKSRRIAIGEAQGRVLSKPLHLEDDFPAFDKAVMDGFAVRACDCASPGARLQIVAAVPAGATDEIIIGPMQAARINTGARIPAGADSIVKIEDSRIVENSVELLASVAPGKHIRKRGEDRKKGDVVLRPPLRLGPAQIAAAATAGHAELVVSDDVRVAILPTGDELIQPGQPCLPGQTYESNALTLACLTRQFGGVPVQMDVAPDDPELLKSALLSALRQPVVLTAGGMSMGTLDLVPQVCADLGVKWLFHGVQLRPGKPIAYGQGPDGQHVLGLPGNPVSVFVCAWLFARMIIRGMAGFPPGPPPTVLATLNGELRSSRDSRPAYVPARLASLERFSASGTSFAATPVPWSGSDDLLGLSDANSLLVWPDPSSPLTERSCVECIPLDETWE